MKKLFIILLALAAIPAYGVTGSPALPLPQHLETRLNHSATSGPQVALGTQITDKKVQVLRAVYDFTVLGGTSAVTYNLRDREGGNAIVPLNAIVTQVMIDEITACEGSDASTSISFGLNTAVDLRAATDHDDFAGIIAGIPVGTAATSVKATADRNVTATVTVGNITACKLNVYLWYLVGAD